MNQQASHRVTKAFIFMVNKLWLLFATLVILTALVFTLLRFALPKVNYYKADIEHWIETQYQVEVDIEQINAEWGASGPVLVLNQFEIKSDDGQLDLIELAEVKIEIDALGTLLTGRLVTEDISLIGLRANVLLDRQLAVRLDTLEEIPSGNEITDIDGTSQVILNNLFGQKKLVVLDSLITVETLRGRQFRYHITQLDIDNFDDIHQFKGQLDDEHGGQLKLVAEIFGDPSDDKSYTHFYLEGQSVDLTQLPIYEKHPKLKPASGKIDWRVWSDWREGRWQTAVGDFQVKAINWQDSTSEEPEKSNPLSSGFEQFSVDFSWKYNTASSGELMFHNAFLQTDEDQTVPFSNVYMLFNQQNKQDIQWEILSHNFQIAPLVKYLALPILSATGDEAELANAELELNLDQLALRLTRNDGVWLPPVVYTHFDRLDFKQLMDMPNVTHLTGEVSFAQGIGEAKLAAENSEIDLHGLFRNKLNFDSLSMRMNWFVDENQKVDFRIDDAFFSNKDLKIAAKTRFFHQDDEPQFALFAEVTDIDASQKSLYLPTGIMPENLVEFLDLSVKSGKLSVAKSAVRGPLSGFPYQGTDGIFSVLGLLDGSHFKYLPDWPAVRDLKAKLLFEGNGMDLQALGGQSGKVKVNFGRAVIKDFSAVNTPFELKIDATAIDNGGYDFLTQSPLADIAESIEVINFSGKVDTKIDLVFGLDDVSNLKMDGSVIPHKKQSSIQLGGFSFDNLDGTLKFDETGILKSDIKAQYFKEPVEVTIVGGQLAEEAALTISGKGKVSSAAVADIVGEKWAELGSGKSEFNALVKVSPPEASQAVVMKFTSDLEGMQIQLPGDLLKNKSDKTPLEVNVRLEEQSSVKIDWREFRGQWWWRENKNQYQHLGGAFLFNNDQELPSSAPNGYYAQATFDQLELEEWLPIINKIINENDSTNATGETSNKTRKPSNASLANTSVIPEINIEIRAKELINPYIKLEDFRLDLLKPLNENWQFRTNGPYGNAIVAVRDNEPWEVRAEKLNLFFTDSFLEQLTEENSEPVVVENTEEIKPLQSQISFKTWPDIVFNCAECNLQEFDLGNLNLELIKQPELLKLKGRIYKSKSHDLNFNLGWQQEEKTELFFENNTQLEFELSSGNIGSLLRKLNYESGVKESRSRIIGKLAWQDTPWNFELLQAEGQADFSLGEGYLSEVSDAKARLFSLFSLQTLSRRLQLDFSDVYKKGFFYDRISGKVSLKNQTLSAHNIYVDGNAAKVSMLGEINLRDKTIEQHALVVPQLTSSLPVLVGWAVEPTTGILVFLLNKLFEPAIEVVTQIEYRIHGPLDQIVVDEVKKSKSKVKYDIPETEVTEEPEEDPNKVSESSDGDG